MAYKYSNQQKDRNIEKHNINLQLEEKNIFLLKESITHITFNFEYFTHGKDSGEDFKDWTQEQLIELLNKMVEYSKKTKIEWLNEKNILTTYSDKVKHHFGFILPNNIPKEKIRWARFRLESKIRLIGFFTNIIPFFFFSIDFS